MNPSQAEAGAVQAVPAKQWSSLRARVAGRAAIVIVCGVVAAALGGAAVWRHESLAAQATEQASPSGVTRLASYDLKLDNELSLQGSRLAISLQGKLSMSRAAGGSWTVFETSGLRGEATDASGAKQPVAGLERPFYVRFSQAGGVDTLAFAADVPKDTRRVLEYLASCLQRTPGEGEQWESRERDTTGWYHARYRRAVDGWVSRQKTAYEGPDAGQSMEILRSETRFRERAGAIVSLTALERLELKQLGVSSRGELSLSELGGAVTTNVSSTPPAGFEQVAFGSATKLSRRDRDLMRADGITFDAALAELRSNSEHKWQWSTLQRLAAHLRQSPATVAEVSRTAAQEPALREGLLQALGECGSPDAQRALLVFASTGSWARQERLLAIARLAQAEAPEVSSIDALGALARGDDDSIAANAAHVQGTLLATARKAALAWYGEKQRAYVQAAAQATSADLRRGYFIGLAAQADDAALSVLKMSLEHASPSVRLTALEALRDVEDRRVSAWIVELMQRETDPAMLAGAFRVARQRQPEDFLPAAQRTLKSTSNVQVLDALVAFLGRAAHDLPEARRLLEQTAAGHPNRTVRAFAASQLGALDQHKTVSAGALLDAPGKSASNKEK